MNFCLIGTVPLSSANADEAFATTWLGCLNNKDTIERLEWTSWELTKTLVLVYNLCIGVDYYNYRINGGDFYGYHER